MLFVVLFLCSLFALRRALLQNSLEERLDSNDNLTIINMPITYYRGNLDAASVPKTNSDTDLADYYEIFACDNYYQLYEKLQLSILLPTNPSWSTNKGFVYVELSTSQYHWQASTVFATNYLSASKVFSNITWAYSNGTGDKIYMRVIAHNKETEYTWTLSYVTSSSRSQRGKFVSSIFNTPSVSTDKSFSPVDQYVISDTIQQVRNDQFQRFQFEFCIDNYVFDSPNYEIVATLAADSSAPLSAFTLYGCPGNSGYYCSPGNFTWFDEVAAPIAQLTMTNGSNPRTNNGEKADLDSGAVLVVLGFGGELTQTNVFQLSAILSTNKQ